MEIFRLPVGPMMKQDRITVLKESPGLELKTINYKNKITGSLVGGGKNMLKYVIK